MAEMYFLVTSGGMVVTESGKPLAFTSREQALWRRAFLGDRFGPLAVEPREVVNEDAACREVTR